MTLDNDLMQELEAHFNKYEIDGMIDNKNRWLIAESAFSVEDGEWVETSWEGEDISDIDGKVEQVPSAKVLESLKKVKEPEIRDFTLSSVNKL